MNTNTAGIYTSWHFLTIRKPSLYFSVYKLNLILSVSQLFILSQLYRDSSLYQLDTVELSRSIRVRAQLTALLPIAQVSFVF